MKYKKSGIVMAFLFTAVMAIQLVLGYQAEQGGSVEWLSPMTWIACLLITVLIGSLIVGALYIYQKIASKKEVKSTTVRELSVTSRKRLFILLVVSFMSVWLVFLLGVYPGFFNYDAPAQWEMYWNKAITEHHPVLHTLLLSFSVRGGNALFGSINAGVAVYFVIQMSMAAAAFSYLNLYLYQKTGGKLQLVLNCLWMGLSPIIIILLLSATKDTIFAIALLVFILLTVELIQDVDSFWNHKGKVALWIISALFTAIFRNNATYVFIPFAVTLFAFMKGKRRKLAYMFGIFVFAFFIYKVPFTSAIVSSGMNGKEFMSVPAQQIVRTYILCQDSLEDSEKELVEQYFDDKAISLYHPKISDLVKSGFNYDRYTENKAEFWKLWSDLARKHPNIYADSLIINTYGFWYPFATLQLYPSNVSYPDSNGEGFLSCDNFYPTESRSLIPVIYNFLLKFENGSIVQGNHLTEWLFKPAIYLYFQLAVLCLAIYKREKKYIIPGIFLLLLYATYLLGPVALVRYVLWMYMLVPLELYAVKDMLGKEKQAERRKHVTR